MYHKPNLVWVGGNMVWNFRFPDVRDHVVRLGSYFTCTCYGDLKCERLLTVADRILVKRPLSKAELIDASNLQIHCPICLETENFHNRGYFWCFCRQCLQPFHKECLQKNLLGGGNELCPYCRAHISNMTETFNSVTTNQNAPDSLKTILEKEVEDSVEPVPVFTKSEPQKFMVHFGSEEEDYSDEGEDISGDPFWKPLFEVAEKHGPLY